MESNICAGGGEKKVQMLQKRCKANKGMDQIK